jgi:oligoribonuclease
MIDLQHEPIAKDPLNLIWIDLEMTGLDTENDVIIEIATIVTDKDLNILGEGPILAIYQPEPLLEGMDEWNTRQHGGSGLTERVRNSTTSLAEAEQATIKFLEQFVDAKTSPMCGNSICQDRRFMARQMPTLEAFFHYRNLDVSSIKEIAKRWRPEVLNGFKKQGSHLAMDDIKDSIAELSHYREVFFNWEEAKG